MRPLRVLIALLFVATAATSSLPPAQGAAQTPRIVAVGDVHGAYEELSGLLRQIGLIDADGAWTGSNSILVQTGDFMDRGRDVRRVMDLLMRLEREAEAAGGRVVVLFGDHEAMNLLGELRDTTPELLAAFAAEDRESVMADAVKEYEVAHFERNPAWGRATRPQREDIKEKWIADQPVGRVEYLRALSPDGVYGAWLRTLPALVVIDEILFMHAGMAPEMAAWTSEAVNERVAAEIAYLDEARAYYRDQDLLTSFPDLGETIQAAATDAGGIDWFTARQEFPARPPELPEGAFEDVDRERRTEALLRMNGWFALAPRGPLWYRGLAESPDAALAAQLPGIFATIGVRAVVAGHTPQSDGIRARLDGRVYLIDTGMLQSVYQGRPSALVIEGDRATAAYADGETVDLPDVASAVVTTE